MINISRKVLVAFVVLALFTGVSAAGEEKVTICHNGNTQEVSVHSHLAQGDYLGACQTPIAPTPELSTTILMSTGMIGLLGFSRLKKNY